MTSAIDICNLSLSLLGDTANITSIDPPEGSAQAEYCARFYPLARKTVLSMHAWTFATKRVALSSVTTAHPPPQTWQYTYAVPSAMLKILGVYRAAAVYDEQKTQVAYEVSGDFNTRVIYSNIDDPVMRYVANVDDTTRFPPLLVNAIAYTLASHLAGPIIKGTESINIGDAMLQRGMAYAKQAMAEDANQSNNSVVERDTRHMAPWMDNRGSLTDWGEAKIIRDV